MPLKGTLNADHIQLNKYQLLVAGLPPLTPLSVGELSETLQTVELPDRTRATTGNTAPLTFDVEFPAHHHVECNAIELWYQESQDPVSPTYKKAATLVMQSAGETNERSYTLLGMFPTQRATPSLEMENDGEMASITWTFSLDQVLPS